MESACEGQELGGAAATGKDDDNFSSGVPKVSGEREEAWESSNKSLPQCRFGDNVFTFGINELERIQSYWGTEDAILGFFKTWNIASKKDVSCLSKMPVATLEALVVGDLARMADHHVTTKRKTASEIAILENVEE
ncbi:hypothetical protein Pfo_005290 [Paulownia fortunei]|nr:hypothetical protein Pfo_005290 [Paulownia fortunei]